jgi:hypothetical protein
MPLCMENIFHDFKTYAELMVLQSVMCNARFTEELHSYFINILKQFKQKQRKQVF